MSINKIPKSVKSFLYQLWCFKFGDAKLVSFLGTELEEKLSLISTLKSLINEYSLKTKNTT